MSLDSQDLSRSTTLYSNHGLCPLSLQRVGHRAGMGSDTDSNFPLTKIQSSTTGARKPGEGTLNDFSQPEICKDDEKRGWSGRRKVKKLETRPVHVETNGEVVEVKLLGRIYEKIVRFSIITRYIVYILPIAFLIAIPFLYFAIFRPDDLFVNTGVRVYLFWAWIEITWLSFWGTKLLSRTMPQVFVTLCGVVSSGTRKYAAILRAVEMQLNLVSWAIISLATFTTFMHPAFNHQVHQKHWISVVKNLLGASVVASLLYLVEKMFVQLISINYHRRSFDIRIKENKNCIRLLGYLYEASRALFPTNCHEFIQEDSIINYSLKNKLSKARHSRSGSATPMRLVGEIGKIGDKMTSALGNIATEITGKQSYAVQSAHHVVSEALKSAEASEALAKRIWLSFVEEDHEALYSADIKEVLGPSRHEIAEECFYVLDEDTNGDVSLEEMIMKVVETGRERKAISASMRDVGQALRVLDQVLVTILLVIVVFTFIGFQHTSFLTTLATAGTTLLSLSFVFAVTTQEFLGSCIFLFVKHPYDVGDRCDISNTTLVVERISLLFTIFKRLDTMRMVQIPNTVLNTLWIENTSRSRAMKEQIEIFISFDTPLEDIETLRSLMEKFVRNPENSRDFQPDVIIETTSVNSMDKLSLKIEIRHKSNWHNENIRATRRSKFMCALVTALRQVPIYRPGGEGDPLGGPKNPGYTVAVTDEWAANAVKKSSEQKKSKRLIPLSTEPKINLDEQLQQNSTLEFQLSDDINKNEPKINKNNDFQEPEESEINTGNTLRCEDNQRLEKIESLRQGLLKRQSTRGRRRVGEVMQSALQQVNTSSNNLAPIQSSRFVVRQNIDLEKQGDLYTQGPR
ncbi:putative MscS family protein C2C4.17c [Erysiphe neolycopersici]|uniref:Putative MscS family protein C2C4.17c n=1 Tax=Erysiphe neolycopersici TaxID=212602 RepID=A0A420HEC2_9PEZI|nr:putative MscS family protein C2C4.17c [Erysiphe neolycopersici]